MVHLNHLVLKQNLTLEALRNIVEKFHSLLTYLFSPPKQKRAFLPSPFFPTVFKANCSVVFSAKFGTKVSKINGVENCPVEIRYQEERIGLLEPISKPCFPPISIIPISRQNKKIN
jgi:hypothetical protein